MEILVAVKNSWLETLALMGGLAVAFGVLARLMPCNPGMTWWKKPRAVLTDFVYWFIVPLFLNLCRTALLCAGLVLLFGGRDPDLLPVRALPLWQQCLLVLLIQDFLLYWIHRGFHGRLGWKFHAVHHSPTVLDWMSTARFHPLNNLLAFVLVDVIVLLLGFPPRALFLLAPFNLAYSALVHANLNWTFGPLKYVLASPVFHRWHHTTLEEGRDRNFASTFPLFDLAFGTFHMPAGKLPEQFGAGEIDFPETFWGQLVHPFRGSTSPEGARAARLRLAVAWGGVAVLSGVMFLGARVYFNTRRALQQQAALQAQAAPAAQAVRAEAPAAALPGLTPGAPQAAPVLAVALSGDGRLFVSGSQDGKVRVWDTATHEERISFPGHTRAVRCVAASADGKLIASGSFDRTVTVWDTETRRERWTRSVGAGVLGVAISGDGRLVVSSCADGTVAVWNASSGLKKHLFPAQIGAVTSVAVTTDGRRLVVPDNRTIKALDADSGQVLFRLSDHNNLVYAVTMSADGRRIVSASMDETVKVWDAGSRRLEHTLTGHNGPVYTVAVSGDGRFVISGGADGTVRVWDAKGQLLHTLKGHTDAVTGVAVSGDGGTIVSSSRDGTLRVWDTHLSPAPRQTARSVAPIE
jgi:WD40 repeat protein/sterol desaturase/sphingolipid hydroxylase (fatty acid hydroxylase superfamily)